MYQLCYQQDDVETVVYQHRLFSVTRVETIYDATDVTMQQMLSLFTDTFV